MSNMKLSLWLFLCIVGTASAELDPNYYLLRCPLALTTIKLNITDVVLKEPRMGASLLRLHFHDCFVQGCDASVLLDDTRNFTGEKTAFPNANSLRGFDVIENIKTSLESLCHATVSCADILALAARDAVVALGGPNWIVGLGRRDSTTANLSAANTDLPAPFLGLDALITAFDKKGLNVTDLVALSGAHTIGKARCSTFKSRIYNDTNIDSEFAKSLQGNCPSTGGDNNLSPLDSTSENSFNIDYYKNLENRKGLLHSDQELFNGGSTDSLVQKYINNPSEFEKDFVNAMIKMSNLSPLTGNNGQIRKICSKVNP